MCGMTMHGDPCGDICFDYVPNGRPRPGCIPVVQTVGLREDTWADLLGTPITDAAKLTERFRRVNFGRLEIEVTVDDSKAYTAPWTAKIGQIFYEPHAEIQGRKRASCGCVANTGGRVW
jgi:hypothetical protein